MNSVAFRLHCEPRRGHPGEFSATSGLIPQHQADGSMSFHLYLNARDVSTAIEGSNFKRNAKSTDAPDHFATGRKNKKRPQRDPRVPRKCRTPREREHHRSAPPAPARLPPPRALAAFLAQSARPLPSRPPPTAALASTETRLRLIRDP